MKITKQRAIEIKRVFLDEIERNRTIPGNMVQPFFDYYNGEFSPGAFAQMPCTCSPKTWIDMIKQVTDAVNEALQSEQSNVVEVVEAEQIELEAAKKKSKKVKETVAVEDKTEQDEETV
jgi:hypothetical protein